MDISAIDPNILIAQLGLVEVLGSAFIAGIFGVIMKHQEKKRTAEREADLKYRQEREAEEAAEKEARKKREEARREFDAAQLNLVFATANGIDVALQALHGDEINGNVEEARKSIREAKSECNKLTNKNTVEHLS